MLQLFRRSPAYTSSAMVSITLSLALSTMASVNAHALSAQTAVTQAQPASPTGDWSGILNVQGQQLHLQLHVSEVNDTLHVLLDSIDQGARSIPGTATLKDLEFSFDIPTIAGHFKGKLNQDGTTMSGIWSQGAGQLPLTWKRM